MGKEVEIVFIKNKKGFFKLGQSKTVKHGYAFNYLIPQNFAVINNKANATFIKSLNKQAVKQQEEQKVEAKKVHGTLNKQEITLKAKSHDEGKLYGSISVSDIVSQLNRDFETTLDKYDIKDYSPIKVLGTSNINISIHSEYATTVKVTIEQDTEKEVEKEKAQVEKRKKKESSVQTYADEQDAPVETDKETKKESTLIDDSIF